MADPLVWSERKELPGVVGLHDCTYSANLMVLVAAGKLDYPLGIYTTAEREALERSDSHPDRIGSNHGFTDEAILERYGIRMHALQDGSRTGLAAALGRRGRAYAVAGDCGRLPAGLRFADCGGPHDVCVVPRGDGTVLWLDPMAQMRAFGRSVPFATVLDYAFFNPLNDARFLELDELATPEEEMFDPRRHVPVAVCTVAAGGTVYADPDRQTVLIESWPGQVAVGLYAMPRSVGGVPAPLVPIRIDLLGPGAEDLRVGWIGVDKVSAIRLA